MKSTLLIGFVSLFTILKGQPVLLESNYAPIGLTGVIYTAVAVSPGAGGANQTWNFSSSITTLAGSFNVINPNSTPCTALFPLSNYALEMPGPQYNYYDRSSSKLEVMGENWPTTCLGGKTYSNYEKLLQFPFNYLDSYTDSYVHNTGSSSATITYDGYGTLITPFATYSNVIRISIVDGTSTTVNWLTSGNPSYTLMVSTSSFTVFFENVTSSIAELEAANAISVYPNPATSKAMLETSIYLNNASIEVFNSFGQMVKCLNNISGNNINLNCENLAEGVYYIQLIQENAVIAVNKLVICKNY